MLQILLLLFFFFIVCALQMSLFPSEKEFAKTFFFVFCFFFFWFCVFTTQSNMSTGKQCCPTTPPSRSITLRCGINLVLVCTFLCWFSSSSGGGAFFFCYSKVAHLGWLRVCLCVSVCVSVCLVLACSVFSTPYHGFWPATRFIQCIHHLPQYCQATHQ